MVGGLDRFLQLWTSDLEPVIGEFSTYSLLTPAQRESWVSVVMGRLGVSYGPPDQSGKPRVAKRRAKKPSTLKLDHSAAALKGVAKNTLPKLKRLGLQTVGDLVHHFPHRHNDFSDIRKVSDLKLGEDQTVVCTVYEAKETRQGPRRSSTHATLVDETGSVRAVWFNQGYLAKSFNPGTRLVISGKVNVFRGSFVFESPEYELLRGEEELVHTGRMVPIYPTVDGLPHRTLRRAVKQALDIGVGQLVEFLPEDTRHRAGLLGLRNAVAQAHYPDSEADWIAARRRLAFDELFPLQLAVLRRKLNWQDEEEAVALAADSHMIGQFLEGLPFELTEAQSKVLAEILDDIAKPRPMSRLLQGDVGSGKTVVAATALLVAALNGCQAALLAPTEILAEQHFLTLAQLFSAASQPGEDGNSFSFRVASHPEPITVGLLLGSLTRKAKSAMQERISEGIVDIAVGTHALLEDDVDPRNLALAIVDEQHRFGVMQRASIRGKSKRPHLLAMSATPIPRSLSLTVYGDLDVSVIDQMPPGRQRIRTRWLEPDSRDAAYAFVRNQVAEGRQAFIVCPLIEESEVIQTRAATKEHERLSTEVFPELNLGLLHGRLALSEKERVMGQFKRRELDILVSTPVVEVGIDVPNATAMLVDGADRFGLAQLHQFRGRVGRGKHQSYCLLLADSPGEGARERLKVVERIHDGFELAEEDLRIRGPGDYMGTRQSGLPQMKFARITDLDILTLARQEALRLLEADPDLSRDEHKLLAERVHEYEAGFSAEIS